MSIKNMEYKKELSTSIIKKDAEKEKELKK